MTTTKQYDALNRLTSIVSLPIRQTPDPIPSASDPISFAYDYNSANQRTRTTHADGSYWIYQYDTLGQVTSGKRFWPDGTPVAGQQFEYGFDDIGNRQTAAHGGNAIQSPIAPVSLSSIGWRRGPRRGGVPPSRAAGKDRSTPLPARASRGEGGGLIRLNAPANSPNLRVEDYTANDLNQYTQRTVPGFAEVQGRARTDATVTVNLQPRRGAHPPSGVVFRALAENPVRHAIAMGVREVFVRATVLDAGAHPVTPEGGCAPRTAGRELNTDDSASPAWHGHEHGAQ